MELVCECGAAAAGIAEIGLTPDHQLRIHWRCRECGRPVSVYKGLADCWRDCPRAGEDESRDTGAAAEMPDPDLVFLSRMGIKLPEAP